ncbi:MAG: hypothetical protein ACI8TP_000162 [Acidimicrobiales bacterium]|jgi:hypothetical protein
MSAVPIPRPINDLGPVFPEKRLQVKPWEDATLDQLGHDPRSLYVERYWVSILGPTATLLLRRLAAGLEIQPEGYDLDPVNWAFELGLGMRGGKNSPFWRAVDRTSRFNATHRQGEVLLVRRKLAPLTLRQVEKLPPHLQRAHAALTAKQLRDHQEQQRRDAA